MFQGLLDQRPTPERCIQAFHLQRTRFEMVAERKLRRRQLTDEGNVEITGRDLREKGRRRARQFVRIWKSVIGVSRILLAIIAEAEQRFPVRIVIRVPEGGIGTRYKPMTDWLDENCGIRGWSITPAGTRGIANDAVAVYHERPDLCGRLRGPLVCSG